MRQDGLWPYGAFLLSSGRPPLPAGALGCLFTQCRPRALGQVRNAALAFCSGCGFFDVAARGCALLGCCHTCSLGW